MDPTSFHLFPHLCVCGYQRSLPLPTMCPLTPSTPVNQNPLWFSLSLALTQMPSLAHTHLTGSGTSTDSSKKPPISSEGLQSSWHKEWAKSLPTLSPTLRRDPRCAKAAASAQNSQNSRMQNQPVPSPFPVPLPKTTASSYLQPLAFRPGG